LTALCLQLETQSYILDLNNQDRNVNPQSFGPAVHFNNTLTILGLDA